MSEVQWQFEGGAFQESLPNGKTSGTLVVSPVSVKFVSEDGEVEMPVTGIQTELGGASNRMLFFKHAEQEGWTFFTTDQGILKHPVFAKDARMAGTRSRVRRARWLSRAATFTFLGFFVAIGLGLWWGKDPMAHAVAKRIPVEMEEKIGEAAFGSHAAANQLVKDEAVLEEFEKLSAPLIEAIGSTRYTFKFHIIEDSTLNAFALPGGTMAIHTGLLLKAGSAEEVLGVMAHELAHVEEQHGMRNLVEMVGLYAILSGLFGDVSGIAAVLVNNAPYLLSMKFSRDHEREADAVGFGYLMKANIDPRGMVNFFETIQKEQAEAEGLDMNGALSILSTHPATQERIDTLNALIKAKAGTGPYRKLGLDFEEFQGKLRGALNK